jgi:hypothetical protein
MKNFKPFISLLLLAVVLAACAPQATAEPTQDIDAIMTQAVGTFAASVSQTQAVLALSQTATSSPTPSASPTLPITTTPGPTSTQAFLPILPTVFLSPTVTGTQYTPTTNPSGLAVGCNNLRLLRDETIPAGTVMKPGETFTKTWKVENNGTCAWLYLYRLVFISGDPMEGVPSRSGNVIEPGKWTQLHVSMKAPSKTGTYTSNWRFANQSGTPFGALLTVSIVVANPTNTPVPPTVTNTPVTPSATQETPSYPGP